jgi:F-type H+-transporting ATPase subunit b
VLGEMLGPFLVFLIAQLVVFAVIVIILRKLLLSDTLSAVNRMKAAEAELGKKEEVMRQKMESHEQEFTKNKETAEAELEKRREGTEQDLARMKERMQEDAKTAADKIISDAQLNKEKIREQLVREMDEKAVDFAGDVFKLVISKEVGDKLNMAFIEELIVALSDVDETSIHVEADEAHFISGHSLDTGQKAQLEKLMAEKFDVSVKIEEEIDEKLLGGLIIKLGSLEIDGSLLNRFNEAILEVKKTV